MIDPAWTAKFIVENPIPQGTSIEGRILYDNNAIRTLMARPTEIEEQHLMALLEENADIFIGASYAVLAIENLPAEKSELKEKIVQLVLQSSDPKMMTPRSPIAFSSRLKVAKFSSDPKVLVKIESEIAEFYESGAAKALWNKWKNQDQFKTNLGYYQRIFTIHAPESMRGEFGGKLDSMTAFNVQMFINDDSIDHEEKVERLSRAEGYNFGKQAHEQLGAVSSLGSVAIVDHQVALKWAESAPSEHLKVWAKLTIAPALAKADREAARRLIADCYDEILELDSSSRNIINYNFSPAMIAARGLPLAASVDPQLLGKCIETTMAAITNLEASNSGSAKEHMFQAIAAIAAYDREKAKTIFEKYEDDVQVSTAAAFFRALVAIRPEQVLDEYREMPTRNSQGTDYRIYVRNELLPILTQETDRGFWNQMNNSGSAGFNVKILDQ